MRETVAFHDALVSFAERREIKMNRDQKKVRFSVIIPVYNVEDYLDKCLQSIMGQNYKSLEVIIIDDGSTDSSYIKCLEWETSYENIVVYSQDNQGVSSARNKGLDMAKGEWIIFVDPDDYLEENFFDELSTINRRYDLVQYAFYIDYINQNGQLEILEVKNMLKETINHMEVVQFNYMCMVGLSVNDVLRWNSGGKLSENRREGMVWQFVFKKKIIDRYNICFKESLIYKEDEIFMMEYLVYTNCVKCIHVPMYHYFQSATSISRRITETQKIENKLCLLSAKNYLRKKIIDIEDIDILELYAGSNVLSILEIALRCSIGKLSYEYFKRYITDECVLKSVKLIPIQLKNLKFNIMLLLLKLKWYRLVYIIVRIFCELGGDKVLRKMLK